MKNIMKNISASEISVFSFLMSTLINICQEYNSHIIVKGIFIVFTLCLLALYNWSIRNEMESKNKIEELEWEIEELKIKNEKRWYR